MSKKRNPHMGSSLDDFLKEDGTFEELQVQAIKEVVAWQLDEAMKKVAGRMPALLNAQCKPPKRWTVVSTNAATSEALHTSVR